MKTKKYTFNLTHNSANVQLAPDPYGRFVKYSDAIAYFMSLKPGFQNKLNLMLDFLKIDHNQKILDIDFYHEKDLVQTLSQFGFTQNNICNYLSQYDTFFRSFLKFPGIKDINFMRYAPLNKQYTIDHSQNQWISFNSLEHIYLTLNVAFFPLLDLMEVPDIINAISPNNEKLILHGYKQYFDILMCLLQYAAIIAQPGFIDHYLQEAWLFNKTYKDTTELLIDRSNPFKNCSLNMGVTVHNDFLPIICTEDQEEENNDYVYFCNDINGTIIIERIKNPL